MLLAVEFASVRRHIARFCRRALRMKIYLELHGQRTDANSDHNTGKGQTVAAKEDESDHRNTTHIHMVHSSYISLAKLSIQPILKIIFWSTYIAIMIFVETRRQISHRRPLEWHESKSQHPRPTATQSQSEWEHGVLQRPE